MGSDGISIRIPTFLEAASARASSAAALTGTRPAHVDSCPACQAMFAAEAAFDQRLRQESRILTQQPAPDGIEQLIMSGIHTRNASARATRRRSSPGMWSLAGIGSAVAAAALVGATLAFAAMFASGPGQSFLIAVFAIATLRNIHLGVLMIPAACAAGVWLAGMSLPDVVGQIGRQRMQLGVCDHRQHRIVGVH